MVTHHALPNPTSHPAEVSPLVGFEPLAFLEHLTELEKPLFDILKSVDSHWIDADPGIPMVVQVAITPEWEPNLDALISSLWLNLRSLRNLMPRLPIPAWLIIQADELLSLEGIAEDDDVYELRDRIFTLGRCMHHFLIRLQAYVFEGICLHSAIQDETTTIEDEASSIAELHENVNALFLS